jgi:hypothetical protein
MTTYNALRTITFKERQTERRGRGEGERAPTRMSMREPRSGPEKEAGNT